LGYHQESPASPVFLAVAQNRGCTRAVFIERYGLKSYSHIQRIEKHLAGRGVIEGGDIVDPSSRYGASLKSVDFL